MSDALQVLYTYALEKRLPLCLAGSEYKTHRFAVERMKDKISQHLPADQQQELEKYIDAVSLCDSVELEAMFQAGLSIGLELSRL